MDAIASASTEAQHIIETMDVPLSAAFSTTMATLIGAGLSEADALAKTSALLIKEVAHVIEAAIGSERDGDARTFEAMLDVNAATHHFQGALRQGFHQAASEIGKDGYAPGIARILTGSRALDAVAEILNG